MSPSRTRRPLCNLDYAASTPLRPEALEAERAYDASPYAGANPNALHSLGRAAAQALEGARHDLARALGAHVRPSDVIITGGGTESCQLALLGIAEGVRARNAHRARVIVSALEHDAILDNLPALKAQGFQVDVVRPNAQGIIEPSALEALIGDDVALVSVMLANNETGVIQPVRELAAIAHRAGARMHVDAIQGFLHLPLDVDELGIDALSAAAHKVGGPVSTGLLYLRARTPLVAQARGGGQEAGRRAGTQDVRGALAFAAVTRALAPRIEEDRARVGALADKLYRTLLAHPRIAATMGDPFAVDRLPGIVSIVVDGFESEDLILQLDAAGFEVSAGSACSAASASASHVLLAMGLADERAAGALRISFDDRVDPADLDAFAATLIDVVGE